MHGVVLRQDGVFNLPMRGKSESSIGRELYLWRESNYSGDRLRSSVPIHPLCTNPPETRSSVAGRLGFPDRAESRYKLLKKTPNGPLCALETSHAKYESLPDVDGVLGKPASSDHLKPESPPSSSSSVRGGSNRGATGFLPKNSHKVSQPAVAQRLLTRNSRATSTAESVRRSRPHATQHDRCDHSFARDRTTSVHTRWCIHRGLERTEHLK